MRRKLYIRALSAVLAAGLAMCAAGPAAMAAEEEDVRPAAVELTAEEQEFVDNCAPLKVGFVQDRIPVSFKGEDGSMAGISRYVLDRIERLSGFTFEYVPLPAGDVTYDYLQSQGLDLVTSVEYNEENKKANGILISEPYLTSRKVIVARDGLDFSFDADLSVAVSSGSQTIHKVLAAAYPNFRLVDYDSIRDCFEALRRGMTDLLIQNQYVVEYWKARPAYEELKVIPVLGLDDQLCFSAVVAYGDGDARPQEEGRIIIDVLDKAIAAMTEDEVGSCIIQGVMDTPYSFTVGDFLYRYRFAAAALSLSALVIAVLAVLLMRQRFRALQEQAEAKAKNEFMSAMSHELRTPLNGIIGLNYLMERDMDDPPKLAGYLRRSSATAEYLLRLVNDILDMSSLREGQMELKPRPVDLETLVDTAADLVRGGIADKGLAFDVRADIRWPWVEADPVRVQQVLLHLLENACKFTDAGSVGLRVEQTLSPTGQVITSIEVTDTGRGMSEPFVERVFDAFAQERQTVSSGDQGAGLGLSVSRYLARLMGGDLTVQSRQNQGSRFLFTFPAPRADGDSVQPAPAAETVKRPILVAEDNELNGEIMLELLDGEGYQADLVHNGQEAAEAFQKAAAGHYGAILMDLMMPVMDGFQAAMAIRAMDRPDAKSVKIVACTANDSAEERDRARICGMDGFLAKPVEINALLKMLE